jgi:hypothetical protein
MRQGLNSVSVVGHAGVGSHLLSFPITQADAVDSEADIDSGIKRVRHHEHLFSWQSRPTWKGPPWGRRTSNLANRTQLGVGVQILSCCAQESPYQGLKMRSGIPRRYRGSRLNQAVLAQLSWDHRPQGGRRNYPPKCSLSYYFAAGVPNPSLGR